MSIHEKRWPAGVPCWSDCQVDDVPAAARFYEQVFGWEITEGSSGGGDYLVAHVDGHAVAGIGPKPPGMEMPAVWSTYFATDDVAATAQRMRELGGTVFSDPFDVDDLCRMTFGLDAQGAGLGLWQATGMTGYTRVNEPGAVVWQELHTRDLEGSKDFYAQLFGMQWADVPEVGEPYAMGSLEGRDVVGVHLDTHMPDDVPNHWLVWFGVADTRAWLQEAQAAGALVLMGPFDGPPGTMGVVAAPTGEVFGVIEMSPEDAS